MAIDVKIQCTECGSVADKRLRGDDEELVCPNAECRRNSPNLSNDEYKEVAKALGGQRLLGIVAILFAIGAAVLLVLYVGKPDTWVSTDNPEYVKRLEKEGLSRNTDTSMFLYGAGGCMLLCGVFGILGSRKRYVIEF